MSSKQLARTVLDGKTVTFNLADGPLTGYLCGMDDFHWMIVTPYGDKFLIHKASAASIEISDNPTYEHLSSGMRDSLEVVVAPFRRWVEAAYFGRSPDAPSASEKMEQPA